MFSLVKLPRLLPGMATADTTLSVPSSTYKAHPLVQAGSPNSLVRIFTSQHFEKKSQFCLKSQTSPELRGHHPDRQSPGEGTVGSSVPLGALRDT